MRVTKISEGFHVAYTDWGLLYISRDGDGWNIHSNHARVYGAKPEYVLAGPYDSLADAIYAI